MRAYASLVLLCAPFQGTAWAANFANPIVPAGSGGAANPSVVYKDGFYYWVRSTANGIGIGIAKAKLLQDIGTVPMTMIWRAPSSGTHARKVWAPELQCLRGRWYIYFAADDGNNANHHMYALESNTSGTRRTRKATGPSEASCLHPKTLGPSMASRLRKTMVRCTSCGRAGGA